MSFFIYYFSAYVKKKVTKKKNIYVNSVRNDSFGTFLLARTMIDIVILFIFFVVLRKGKNHV